MTSGDLGAVLHDLLTERPPEVPERATGADGLDRAWWERLHALGLFALPVPVDAGGLGLPLREVTPLFEILGANPTSGPLLWTQLAASAQIRPGDRVGSEHDRAVAGVDVTNVRAGDPVVVPHLAAADALLVMDAEGLVLHDLDEIDFRESAAPLDPWTPVAELLDRRGGRRVGDVFAAARLRSTGTLLTAALQVGVAAEAVRVAVAYAQERRQFGRAIGSFQAVKHLLADAWTGTELARAAVLGAADDLAEVSTAKLLAGTAADANARTAVQVFGGMGFAWETPPHRLLKRAWVLEDEFGTGAEHAERVAGTFA